MLTQHDLREIFDALADLGELAGALVLQHQPPHAPARHYELLRDACTSGGKA